MCSRGPTWITPALLIRTSRRPKRSAAAPIAQRTSSSFPTSQGRASTRWPPDAASSRRARSSSAGSRARMAIRAPSAASSRAISSPKPREPPVITATRSRSWMGGRRRSALAVAARAAPVSRMAAGAASLRRLSREGALTSVLPSVAAMAVEVAVGARLEDELDALVLFVPEGPVPPGGLVEAEPVGDHPREVDLPLLDPLQQGAHVLLHVGLAHLEGEPLVHGGAHRDLVHEPPVDAGPRHGASLAAGQDGLAQHVGAVEGPLQALLAPVDLGC